MYFDFKIISWERISVPLKYEVPILEKIESGEIKSGTDLYVAMDEIASDDLVERELLHDSEEQMTVEQNKGKATIEVVADDRQTTVWSNAKLLDRNAEPEPEFPNGFDDWQETHYHIVAAITEQQIRESVGGDFGGGEDPATSPVLNGASTGELWELAKDWTNQFEKEYEGRDWADGDYFDTIEEFINEKLFPNAGN